MIRDVLVEGDPPVPLWLDVVAPTRDELETLAARYGLHPQLVTDSIQPLHLPKHERTGDVTFMIVRAFDDEARPDDDSVQALTRKIAFFLGNRFLVTVHHREQSLVESIAARYRAAPSPVYLQLLVIELLSSAVETYQKPLEAAEREVHAFEVAILKDRGDAAHWSAVFRTQTRLLVIKRLLWHTLSAVQKYVPHSTTNQPALQDLRERIESLQFFADGLLDDVRNLLTMQLALASHGTNEVMRVLTVFSAFFMPLTFIVGVYGMNFEIPEVHWKYGYVLVWAVMVLTGFVIFRWFRSKRWV